MRLAPLDVLFLGIYLLFVLGMGFVLRRRISGSDDFLLSGRAIPGWVAALAFLSANLGAQEMIGMAASGAKYGMLTSHFYWIGAIPAMVFLGIFMMPFYMLQLVFSFVNAPLFATFLLGMFWRGATGHGAFWGLVAGTGAAGAHYLLTDVAGASSLVSKLAVLHVST